MSLTTRKNRIVLELEELQEDCVYHSEREKIEKIITDLKLLNLCEI